MARYKWQSPQEWLLEKIQSHADNPQELVSIASSLALLTDADTVQDEFQSDMDRDGYFTDLDARAEDDEECNCPEADHPHRHCSEHGIYAEGEDCPGCEAA